MAVGFERWANLIGSTYRLLIQYHEYKLMTVAFSRRQRVNNARMECPARLRRNYQPHAIANRPHHQPLTLSLLRLRNSLASFVLLELDEHKEVHHHTFVLLSLCSKSHQVFMDKNCGTCLRALYSGSQELTVSKAPHNVIMRGTSTERPRIRLYLRQTIGGGQHHPV